MNLSKELLTDQYYNQKLSQQEMADLNNTTHGKIRWLMKKYNIPRRNHSEAKKEKDKKKIYKKYNFNKKWLEEQYWKKIKSSIQIAEVCGCSDSTIRYWMEIFNIPRRSILKKNLTEKEIIPKKGEKNPNWKGGKRKSKGYILIYAPNHPNARQNEVYEHVYIMEKSIGRYIKSGECIHHINGRKSDNRIENLYLCKNNSEHHKIHNQLNKTALELFNSKKFGKIYFNKDKGKYYIIFFDGGINV